MTGIINSIFGGGNSDNGAQAKSSKARKRQRQVKLLNSISLRHQKPRQIAKSAVKAGRLAAPRSYGLRAALPPINCEPSNGSI